MTQHTNQRYLVCITLAEHGRFGKARRTNERTNAAPEVPLVTGGRRDKEGPVDRYSLQQDEVESSDEDEALQEGSEEREGGADHETASLPVLGRGPDEPGEDENGDDDDGGDAEQGWGPDQPGD